MIARLGRSISPYQAVRRSLLAVTMTLPCVSLALEVLAMTSSLRAALWPLQTQEMTTVAECLSLSQYARVRNQAGGHCGPEFSQLRFPEVI
ncbi:hypothetical protein M2320_000940 [Rhodoblastus acidophilus]|nr:hypothetical protein [Rhodoblastus acidophilus]